MDPPLTLQTLNKDCVLEILKYVPLPDCMSLRLTCSQLKNAVDEHFRTGVKTLPVVLSSRYTPEYVAQFNEHCEGHSDGHKYEKNVYGSGDSQLTLWEEKNFYPERVRPKHFRLDNYLVLFDSAKFDQFIDFITKYMPGITKLAVIIDHNYHLKNVPTILNLYRKQLKALLLEKTLRGVSLDSLDYELFMPGSSFKPSKKFYDSLSKLQALEELYFFCKAHFTLRFDDDIPEDLEVLQDFDHNPRTPGNQCIGRLALRLRVLHHDCDTFFQGFLFRPETHETLEELACGSHQGLIESRATFPKLERLIHHAMICQLFPVTPVIVPMVRDVWLNVDLRINQKMMAILNRLPHLERIRYYSFEKRALQHENPVSNRTIQIIEIDHLRDEFADVWDLKESMKHFKNLKKLIVQKLDFFEVIGEELPAPEPEE